MKVLIKMCLISNQDIYLNYEKGKLQEILDFLLEKGVIRQKNSQYSSPIVLVKKKSG